MALPVGNFNPGEGSGIHLQDLGRNEFGYISSEPFVIDRERAYLPPGTVVRRHAGSQRCVKISRQHHGLVVEFLGGLRRDSWTARNYQHGDLRIAQIVCGGISYARWTKRQFYTSLRTMEVNEAGYIPRRAVIVNKWGSKQAPEALEITKRCGAPLVRVRRIGRRGHEVEFDRGIWTPLFLAHGH